MNAAIAYLEAQLEVLETNEPINRARGNDAQANLEQSSATEIRHALKLLGVAVAHPSQFSQPMRCKTGNVDSSSRTNQSHIPCA